jgi:HTH-type transcriptional regulator, sugar sensing transcriptional regulator
MTENTQLERILIEFGLSESESTLYLAGLRLGKTSILKLSRESGLKRPTVYKLIEKLLLRNIFAKIEEGWKVYYEAQNPRVLYQILDQKTILLDDNFPLLSNLYTAKNTSGVMNYQGIKEIKYLYTNILNEVGYMQKYYVICNQELFMSLDKVFFEGFIRDRNAKNPNLKMIFTESEEANSSKKYQSKSNVAIKLLPESRVYRQNIIITPNRLIIHNLEKPTSAVVVFQKPIIESFQSIFDILWNNIDEK